MSLHILHLSDLHIGKTTESSLGRNLEDLPALIAEKLEGEKVNEIVITGDIFDHTGLENGRADESIDEATTFFEKLIAELNYFENNLSKTNLIFIPGNHELEQKNFKEKKPYYEAFNKFLIKFYRIVPDYYHENGFPIVKVLHDQKVGIVGFSSAHLMTNNDNKTYQASYIDNAQLQFVRKKLDTINNIEDYSVISLLHHHFYALEETKKEFHDITSLSNSEQFLQLLRRYNIKLVLHGHKHESINRRINTSFNLKDADKLVTVLGCGASHDYSTKNSFNHITLYNENSGTQLRIINYTQTNSGFTQTDPIELPITNTKKISIEILKSLARYEEINKLYTDISDVDTCFSACTKLLTIIDNTIGKITTAANLLDSNYIYIVALLGSLHFRTSILKKQVTFLPVIKAFMRKGFEGHFKKNISAIFDLMSTPSFYDVNKKYTLTKENLSKKEKTTLSFILVGMYLSEFYISIRDHGEIFFNHKIKKKSDIIINEGTLNQNICGNKIYFSINEDRRSLDIFAACKTALAHKAVALIIKEFEILLTPFEADFADIGVKIYYINPIITNQSCDASKHLKSYTFGAYIPTLIPLLAGENIYKESETFARELIQNSIDAINLRKKIDDHCKEDFTGHISIVIGQDKDSDYFSIKDNGTGMSRYILERYFTTIGRSFYKSDDFTNLQSDYSPISQFGIGFLSCFLVGSRVKVLTKYFEENERNESETNEHGYVLDIPNFDGCFFIEKMDQKEVGTTITIHSDTTNIKFNAKKILEYINDNIVNIPIPITITQDKKTKVLKPNSLLDKILTQTSKHNLFFFIPLQDISNRVLLRNDITQNQEHLGILFYKKDSDLFQAQNIQILNTGIIISDINNVYKSFCDLGLHYFDIVANLPSSYIELDVSRDSIKGDLKDVQFQRIRTRLEDHIQEHFASSINSYPLPYAFLNQVNSQKFPTEALCLDVDNGNIAIKIKNDYKNYDIFAQTHKFINIISNISLKKANIAFENYFNDILKRIRAYSSSSYIQIINDTFTETPTRQQQLLQQQFSLFNNNPSTHTKNFGSVQNFSHILQQPVGKAWFRIELQ